MDPQQQSDVVQDQQPSQQQPTEQEQDQPTKKPRLDKEIEDKQQQDHEGKQATENEQQQQQQMNGHSVIESNNNTNNGEGSLLSPKRKQTKRSIVVGGSHRVELPPPTATIIEKLHFLVKHNLLPLLSVAAASTTHTHAISTTTSGAGSTSSTSGAASDVSNALLKMTEAFHGQESLDQMKQLLMRYSHPPPQPQPDAETSTTSSATTENTTGESNPSSALAGESESSSADATEELSKLIESVVTSDTFTQFLAWYRLKTDLKFADPTQQLEEKQQSKPKYQQVHATLQGNHIKFDMKTLTLTIGRGSPDDSDVQCGDFFDLQKAVRGLAASPAALHAAQQSPTFAADDKKRKVGGSSGKQGGAFATTTHLSPEQRLEQIQRVSKLHCVVLYDEVVNQFVLLNYSKNGTFVDGYVYRDEIAPLMNGSVIRIGVETFKFRTKKGAK